jgi:hypothetical protein
VNLSSLRKCLHAWLQHKLPSRPPQHAKNQEHRQYAKPAQTRLRSVLRTITSYILCERSPVRFGLIWQNRRKLIQPFLLIQTQMSAVATHDPLVKDASGKLLKLFLLQCAQMSRRHLGTLRDGFQRYLAPLALKLQLSTKRHFMLPHPASTVCATKRFYAFQGLQPIFMPCGQLDCGLHTQNIRDKNATLLVHFGTREPKGLPTSCVKSYL